MVEIPADVARFALRRGVEGRTWLARLPAIVAECSEQWELELDEVVPASYSLVAMTRRADGSPAVLKVTFPEPEGQHEAEALRLWNGDGIVLPYEADPERSALLLERLEPGTPLREHGDEREALAIACGLLRRLWRPVGSDAPYERARDLASSWAESTLRIFASVQPAFGPRLAQEAAALFREL